MKREPNRIRTLRFEVWQPGKDAGEDERSAAKATRDRWHKLAEQVQQAVNCVWQSWLCWHVTNKTPRRLRKAYEIRAAWYHQCERTKPARADFATKREHETAMKAWAAECKRTEPEFPKILAIDKACAKFIYDELAETCPDLNTSTRELARNVTQGKITGRKAAHGNIPGWHSVLLCRESIPSSTRKQPIPFTKKPEQTRLYPPDETYHRWRIRLRLDRVAVAGRKTATSTEDMIELRTDVRGIHGHTKILWDILSGKAELCGSALSWDDRRRKWYVLVSYKQDASALPAKPELDAALTAHVVPRCDHPLSLLLPDGYALKLMGQGRPVEYTRRRMLEARFGRWENYRYMQRAGRGHGRQRALNWKEKFERDWRNFCTTFNRVAARQIVEACVSRGIGTLVVHQPEGRKSDTRFLAQAGKLPRTESTGWPWYQLSKFIEEAAADVGIAVEVVAWGRRDKAAA